MTHVHLPFPDRHAAGEALADALVGVDLGPDPIVLGIPRGGVPVADVVARRLGLPLDVLVAHKVGAPDQPEFAIGAVAADGTNVIDPVAQKTASKAEISQAFAREVQHAVARQQALRGAGHEPVLHGRGVVIVDDGIAVGATLEAAVRSARAAGAARIVAAVPVASIDGAERIRACADALVAVAEPEWFMAVGEWYLDFRPVTDDEVHDLLANAGRTPARPHR